MDVLSVCVGVVAGGLAVLLYYISKYSGFLRIDVTNPNKDVYLIDIRKDLDKLPNKKIIVLKIDTKYRKPQ